MNRILFEEQASEYNLDPRDARFEHVRGVLRMGVGDTFDVGVVNGPVGKATIRTLDASELVSDVEWGAPPQKPPPVHLIVGMCRPATARKILATIPTLGVREVSFVPAARSDPAYARSGLWTKAEWRPRLIEGVEQAFDTWLPVLYLPDSLEACLKSLPGSSRKFALDVYEASQPLSAVEIPGEEPACLAVGPERGWSGKDRELLREHGFTLVGLSERVLRVETAVTVGLALLLARMGRL